MYECQRRPQSVIMLPDGLELDGTAPRTREEGSNEAARGVTNVAENEDERGFNGEAKEKPDAIGPAWIDRGTICSSAKSWRIRGL